MAIGEYACIVIKALLGGMLFIGSYWALVGIMYTISNLLYRGTHNMNNGCLLGIENCYDTLLCYNKLDNCIAAALVIYSITFTIIFIGVFIYYRSKSENNVNMQLNINSDLMMTF